MTDELILSRTDKPATGLLPIGVIVVNFNGGQYLARCVEALLVSDSPLEIVVVDNNSSDSSIESIADLDVGNHQIKIIKNAENVGFSRGVNVGRMQIQSNTLLLLNPDCVVYPHTIFKLHTVLHSDQQFGLVGPLVFNENGTEQRGCRRNEPTLKRSIITSLWLGKKFTGVDQTGQMLSVNPVAVDAVSGSCLMIRSALFDHLGGMDEGYFLHCEDLDLCHRARDANYKVIFTSAVSVFHRQGGSGGAGFGRIELLKHQGMLRYYQQHYANGQGAREKIVGVFIHAMVWSHFAMAMAIHRVKRFVNRNKQQLPLNGRFLPLDQACIVVTGANSDVGDSLLNQLGDQKINCLAVSRNPPSESVGPGSDHIRWLASSYFELAPADDLPELDSWVHLAPIWTVSSFRSLLTRCGVKRVVGLSSTSVIAKSASTDPRELALVTAIKRGEQSLVEMAAATDCNWAILRPTLIYGGPRNKNINLIKRIIRLTGRFALVGDAIGNRQPVHVDDVATACRQLVNRPRVTGYYDLPGSEVLGYGEMVGRVFIAMNRPQKIVVISEKLASTVLGVVRKIPGFAMFTPQMASRMSVDQTFSADKAVNEFDYRPGPFRP